MDHQQLLDELPLWGFLVVTVVLFLLVGELGFRLARRRREEADDASKSHAGIILAALLGLLALLLGFSFSIVDSRFQTRKTLVLDEANAIGTTYLRAEMLPEPYGERIRGLLGEYVDSRVNLKSREDLADVLEEAEDLHTRLWEEAERVAEEQPTPIVALFVSSLNEMIDLHEKRVTVGLYHRLPDAILVTLLVVGLLSMGILGYSSGLSRRRAFGPMASVVVAIAMVIVLIVAMDRPWQRLVGVSQQSLQDVQQYIESEGPRLQQDLSSTEP